MSVSAHVCGHNMMCACYFVDKQDNGKMYKEAKILENPEKVKFSEVPPTHTRPLRWHITADQNSLQISARVETDNGQLAAEIRQIRFA